MRPFLKLPRKVGLPIGVKPLKGIAMGHEHTSVIFLIASFYRLAPVRCWFGAAPTTPNGVYNFPPKRKLDFSFFHIRHDVSAFSVCV